MKKNGVSQSLNNSFSSSAWRCLIKIVYINLLSELALWGMPRVPALERLWLKDQKLKARPGLHNEFESAWIT